MVCYEAGQATVTHHHPRQDEIFYIVEGKGEVWVGEERIAVGPSSTILIPAHKPHGVAASPDSRLVIMFVKGPGILDAPAKAAGDAAPTRIPQPT